MTYRILILQLCAIVLLAACSESDDNDSIANDTPVTFHVGGEWKAASLSSRATDDDITLDETRYPEQIYVYTSGTGAQAGAYATTPFVITRSSDNDIDGYIAYHITNVSPEWTIMTAKDVTFTAYGIYPNGTTDWKASPGESNLPIYSKDADYIKGVTSTRQDNHILFDMQHQQAMIRFLFNEDDPIRYFKLKKFSVRARNSSGVNQTLSYIADGDEPWLISNNDVYGETATSQFTTAAYLYVLPSLWKTLTNSNKQMTLSFTYDVYDFGEDGYRDGSTAAGSTVDDVITRKDVTLSVQVTPTFASAAAAATFPTAGYYYDMQISISPEHLYVLSDRDQTVVINIYQ